MPLVDTLILLRWVAIDALYREPASEPVRLLEALAYTGWLRRALQLPPSDSLVLLRAWNTLNNDCLSPDLLVSILDLYAD